MDRAPGTSRVQPGGLVHCCQRLWLDSAPYSNCPCTASNRPDLPGRHHFLKVSGP